MASKEYKDENYRNSVTNLEAEAPAVRLRELIAKHGVAKASRISGYSVPHISNVKAGRRYKNQLQPLIKDLKLRKLVRPKLCSCCGQERVVFTLQARCIECTVLELAKAGSIVLEVG